ncbi:MAG: hypothetical protein ACKOA8_20705 [Deltaproteobacteria bacterium]
MFKRSFFLICFLSSLSIVSWAATGKNCTEVIMHFSHFVEMEGVKPPRREQLEMIEAQLNYLYGSLAHAKYLGVPRGDKEVEITGEELSGENTTRIHYNFKGTILLQKGPRTRHTFPLPRVPTEKGIYEPALDSNGFNRATDPHYQSFDDYWYFWNPTRKGSGLKEGLHYDMVKAQIERIRNTERSTPEYEKLVNSDGTIAISAFFGMDDPSHSSNAIRGKDLGAFGYRGFKKGLLAMGFQIQSLSLADKKSLLGGHHFQGFTLERLTKSTPAGNLEILLFFGPSGISEPSRPFHYLFKNALEHSSVMIYDGHSGLGAHLDIPSIEEMEGFKIERNPKDYQIFFLNSCSSYSYYNLSYHQLKERRHPTKYLDVLANGLETAFDETQTSNLALIRAIDQWATRGKKQTYQSLAKTMEADNLFFVSGDQDN